MKTSICVSPYLRKGCFASKGSSLSLSLSFYSPTSLSFFSFNYFYLFETPLDSQRRGLRAHTVASIFTSYEASCDGTEMCKASLHALKIKQSQHGKTGDLCWRK